MELKYLLAVLVWLGCVAPVFAQQTQSTVQPNVPALGTLVEQSGPALRQNFQAAINDINVLFARGGGGGTTNLTVGTTPVLSGQTQQLLYDNAGVLGEIIKANNCLYGTNGTGVPSCLTAIPSGVTVPLVNGVAYPSIPSLNTVPVVTGSNTITYEQIPNAALSNPSTMVNGQTCTLGSSCTISSSAGTITIGVTTIATGTTNQLLYDNAGTLGEVTKGNNCIYGTNGTGVPSCVTTFPFIVSPISGGIPYFSSTTTTGSSALLAANCAMFGGGVGTAPATSTSTCPTISSAGLVNVQNTTSSTSATTGALVVGGGFGAAATSNIILPTITVAANDITNGVFSVKKTLTFGTPGGASTGVFAAIDGAVTIGEGTWSNQIGIIGHVFNSNTQHSQPGSTASAVATYGVGVCQVASCSATWGGVMAAYDLSNQTPAVNALIGLEVDNYAHGAGGGGRVGLQIVSSTPDNLGTLNTTDYGILFAGNGAASTGQFANLIYGGTAKAVNGINFNAMNLTGSAWLSPGASIDATGHAVLANLTTPAIFGGTLPGSVAIFTSTSSGSPSGDIFAFRGSTIQFQTTLATSTFVSFSPTLAIFGDGTGQHIASSQSTPPALTLCGTGSPSIVGSDTAGIVTMGTSATGCTITFTAAYNAAPYCVVTWIANPLAAQSYTTSATAIVLSQTTATGNKAQYHCIAQSNG